MLNDTTHPYFVQIKVKENSVVRLPSENVDIFWNGGKNKTCQTL